MVDYAQGTGTSGTLIIRDDGFTVQAIIRNTQSATHASGKGWSITVGGGSASGSFSINGAQEVVVWSGGIGVTTGISFTMGATGTSGLGGPTTINVTIFRATVAGPPVAYGWSNMSVQTGQINFGGPASNGGSGIDFYLVRYGLSNPVEAGAYTQFTTGTGANPVSGLIPGKTYYSVVYTHNGVGYSGASAVAAGTTLAPARVKIGGHYKFGIPYIKVAGVYKMALPFLKKLGVYKRTG